MKTSPHLPLHTPGTDGPRRLCDHLWSDIKISIHVVQLQKRAVKGALKSATCIPIVNNSGEWTEDKESKETLSWIANRAQVLKVSTTNVHREHQCATLTSTGFLN